MKVADVLALLLSFGYKEKEIMELAYKLQPLLRPIEPPNSAGGTSVNTIINWTNLTQNRTLLRPNTTSKNEHTKEKQGSQSTPPIANPRNQSNLQPVWNLQFSKNLELISSTGYRPATTFEMVKPLLVLPVPSDLGVALTLSNTT